MGLDPKLADAYVSKAREAYNAFLRHAPQEAKDQIEQARSKVGRS
jgi:hypothetical protein